MFNRLYARIMRHATSPHAIWWLAGLTFAEASVFPLPPETLLVPMVLAHRDRAWAYAALCTLCSVAGGLLGWVIGAALLDTVARPIVHFYHAENTLAGLQALFQRWGVAIILLKGLTPIPYKLVTIASGMAHFAIIPFMLASMVTRGLRFFLIAGLLRRYGAPIEKVLQERLPLIAGACALGIVAAIVGLRYL